MTRELEDVLETTTPGEIRRVSSKVKQLHCAGRNRTYDLQVMSLAS